MRRVRKHHFSAPLALHDGVIAEVRLRGGGAGTEVLVPRDVEHAADAVVACGLALDGQGEARGREEGLTGACERGSVAQGKRLLGEERRGDVA